MSLCLSTQGIMLVYDITNEKSFDNIRNWIRNIEEVRVPFWFFWARPLSQEPGEGVERGMEPRHLLST